MRKKGLCVLLSGLMLMSTLSLAACSKAPAENPQPSSQPSPQETKEPMKIKWLGYPTSGMYPENDAYIVEELNKRFNVDLEVIKADPSKEDQLQMLFATGEFPDHFLVGAGFVQRIIGDGVVREIPEEMVKRVAPTFYESVMKYHPNVVKQDVYQNGKFMAIPEGKGELFPMTGIRTDWLKKVGAEMPTNLAELEEVCRLFTEADPDGNGKKDTYATFLNGNYDNIQTLAYTFGISLPGGVVKDDSWLLDANGSLVKAQVSENYKNLLKYVANLYKKGYIHPDVTLKADEIGSLFSDGVIGMRTSSSTAFLPKYRPSEWFALTFSKNPSATADIMPPLKDNNGNEAVHERQSSAWRYMCSGVNTSDEKLEKILEIIEAQLTDMEVHNLVWRGKEGTHFTVDEEGMAILKDEYSTTEKQAELGIKYFIANFRNDEQSILSSGKESKKLSEKQDSYKVVNQIIPSGTVMENVKKYGADVKKIEQEFYLKAATGSIDIDAEWDKYVGEWNKAGGEKITQEATEIYNKMNKK